MRRKKISIIGALVLGLVMSGCGSVPTRLEPNARKAYSYTLGAHETLVYTLDPAAGTDNGYATAGTAIDVDGIDWSVTGNNTMIPWRIGGKSLSSAERTIVSQTALTSDVNRISVEFGNASDIIVNSINLKVYDENEDEKANINESFKANDTVVFEKTDDTSWADCFYKFTFTVTVNGTKNKFFEFVGASFLYFDDSGTDPVEPTGITLNKTAVNLLKDDTCQLTSSLQPGGASGTVTWSSSNENVVTVSSTGLVTAEGEGTATVTATVGTLTATCDFTVYESINYGDENNPLSVEEAIVAIQLGGDVITSQPLYVSGVVGSNKAVYSNKYDEVWLESSDKTNAKAFEIYKAVLGSGITGTFASADCFKGYTIVAYGFGTKYNSTYELTTSSNDPKNPEIQSLVAPEVTAISLNESSVEVVVAGTVTLYATPTPSNVYPTITWETSNNKVATVNAGVVTGVHKGTATITAKVSESIKAECVVTVNDPEPISGNGLELARTISVGDVVFMTAEEPTQKFVLSSINGSGTNYGVGTKYYNSVPAIGDFGLDVVAGSENGTFAFQVKDGSNKYLCWTSGNSLKIDAELNANSSWYVEIDNDGNPIITNAAAFAAESNRAIWWNSGSPRFASYENKENGVNGYYAPRLYKVVDFDDVIARVSTFATLHGTETEENSVISVSNVQLRFGARLSQVDWETLKNNWGITGYGIMMAKETTLKTTYGRDSIAEAFDQNDTLTVVSKGNGYTPDESGKNYVFSIRINMTHYDVKICAAPYIIIGGLHYFFTEQDYSVKTLADYYLLPEHSGCELSNEALTILSNN